MDIVLVPGLWLNAATWDPVLPHLAGHRTHPLTLPGMASRDDDRTGITLADHVQAVVAAIDRCEAPVLLVGHSAGCGIAHQALDARPDRVARAVHVGGFPSEAGERLLSGLDAVDGEVPMPDWAEMGEEANLVDLSAAQVDALYAEAVPVPVGVVEGEVRLGDPRRHEVPMTLVCPEYRVADLQAWVDEGALPEVSAAQQVAYVDLPTGHWPQVTRPRELAEAILSAAP